LSEIAPESDEIVLGRKEVSWLLGVTFAGLGTGFVLLILTLSTIYAIVLCSFGVLIVWPLAKKEKGGGFALNATGIYLISAIVGVAVGWGSTFGTGLPVGNILQRLSTLALNR
jgi:hypothetical protein